MAVALSDSFAEDGQIALFDHSWYGRVLVERVEKWVKKKIWNQAYEQINQFERWLSDDGQVIVKFLFHISQKEQRRRLRALEKTRANVGRVAKEELAPELALRRVDRRDEKCSPRRLAARALTVVEATDGRWTRVKVFETLVRSMEQALAGARRRQPASAARARPGRDASSARGAPASHLARERSVRGRGWPADPGVSGCSRSVTSRVT